MTIYKIMKHLFPITFLFLFIFLTGLFADEVAIPVPQKEVSQDYQSIALLSNLLPASALPISWIPIGDAGNSGDPLTHQLGAVKNNFEIAQYEVTAAQYTVFLNAVATEQDPHHLYDENMEKNPAIACITRSGDQPPFVYSTISGRENIPITYVSHNNALRFINWLENGYPSRDAGDDIITASTEIGAYTFSNQGNQERATRNIDSTFYLPTQDEWVKAAYYKGGNLHAGYWMYPTAHDIAPYYQYGLPENRANYQTKVASWSTWGQSFKLLLVNDSPQSVSGYGVSDMGGNVAEWTDSTDLQSNNFVLGGSWQSEYSIWNNNDLMRTANPKTQDPTIGSETVGFRIAAIANNPSPAASIATTDTSVAITPDQPVILQSTNPTSSSWFSNLSTSEKVALGVGVATLLAAGIFYGGPALLAFCWTDAIIKVPAANVFTQATVPVVTTAMPITEEGELLQQADTLLDKATEMFERLGGTVAQAEEI